MLETPLRRTCRTRPATRALQLSEIPTINLGGVDYLQFLLDIDQGIGSPNQFLSLNQVQIFQSTADRVGFSVSATTTPVASFPGAPAATEVFRMNNGAYTGVGAGGTTIQLNSSLNSGGGAGDMFLLVRKSDFNVAC